VDLFDEELLTFWRSLNSHNVKYIMVGGIAVNFNGYQRSTDDVDVWLEDTVENRQKFRSAFKAYSSIDLFMMETIQIVPGWTSFNLNDGTRLDLMIDVKGLEGFTFDECLQLSIKAEIFNLQIPFLQLNQLILSKKAANRPKDQIDVIYLEKIKQLLEEQNKS
jgi:predicted nucleotidyltransferase